MGQQGMGAGYMGHRDNNVSQVGIVFKAKNVGVFRVSYPPK